MENAGALSLDNWGKLNAEYLWVAAIVVSHTKLKSFVGIVVHIGVCVVILASTARRSSRS